MGQHIGCGQCASLPFMLCGNSFQHGCIPGAQSRQMIDEKLRPRGDHGVDVQLVGSTADSRHHIDQGVGDRRRDAQRHLAQIDGGDDLRTRQGRIHLVDQPCHRG